MPDPHAQAIESVLRTSKELKRLFDRLGNTEHPRGRVLSAYRQARRAMRGAVDDPVQARLVLEELRLAVYATMAETLGAAVESGVTQAHQELEIYDIPVVESDVAQLSIEMAEGWQAVFDGQVSAIYAMVLTGAADEGLILGGEDRAGMLSPAPVVNEGTRWLALAIGAASTHVIAPSLTRAGKRQDEYRRQAVAAIDERTTDCCLQVHGQTTTMKGDFILTGTPRYADKLHDRPFHRRCRTAIALVRAQDVDDEWTQQMTSAARAELDARAEAQSHIDEIKKQLADLGQTPDIRIRKDDTQQIKSLRTKLRNWKAQERVEIHPAHARSRR